MNSTNRRVSLSAPDISCGHCAAAIRAAVGGLDGVSRVDTDIEAKRVTVEYDPERVTLDRIEAAMDEEGYPVQK